MQEFFRLSSAFGPPAAIDVDKANARGIKLRRVDNFINQPDGMHRAGIDQFTRQQKIPSHAFADMAEQMRHHHGGDEPATHFGIAERDSAVAIARSQTVTKPAPPATAGPCTAAMVGLGSV